MSYYDKKHSISGDFEESYKAIASEKGRFSAGFWFWSHTFQTLTEYFRFSISKGVIMFANYLKITLRNIKKNKSFTIINIFGLSSGIISCLLISLFVMYELSYDRFPEKADSIYRVVLERKYPDRTRHWGWTATGLADDVERDLPEVVQATRILNEMGETQISYDEFKYIEDKVLYGEENFFDFFPVPFLAGDPGTALRDKFSIVLTEKAAGKYFGDEDPLGKTMLVRNRWADNIPHVITGVMKEIPKQSHFHCDFLLSYNSTRVSENPQWGYWQVFNYLLLQDGCDPEIVEAKFNDVIVNRYIAPLIVEDGTTTFADYLAAGNAYNFYLQPLKDIHLKSMIEHELEANGNITYVYIFSIIAVFILVIASINFMNLSTARSVNRAREIGVRKALGSFRKQLITQFIFESVFMCAVSLIIALIAAELLLPVFSEFTGTVLELKYFSNIYIIPGIIAFTIVLGLVSGSYPAFFLSSFDPVSVLKDNSRQGSGSRIVRNCLVVFQFASSISLIAGTMIIGNQIDFMLKKDPGFNEEQVLILSNGDSIGDRIPVFKEELLKNSSVINIGGSGQYPTQATHTAHFILMETGNSASMYNTSIGFDFVETIGFDVIQGRSFDTRYATDSSAVLLNETAVRVLGISDPIGKKFQGFRYPITIIGVLKDFNFRSLHRDIGPLVIFNTRDRRASYFAIRVRSEDIRDTISYIRNVWDDLTGRAPFNYTFMDQDMENWYSSETKTGQITSVFSMLAIAIGCLGLLGLAAFISEQRTKEIGIRKSIGASMWSIMYLLSRDFIKLVVMAVMLAFPVTYFIMNNWLNNFAYRTGISITTFLGAGLLTLIIAMLTVGYQVVKAANSDPVKSLRYE